MNAKLQRVQHYLRRFGLLNLVEQIRYRVTVFRTKKENRAFRTLHPEFAVPPNHLAYDAYTTPHHGFYYNTGISTAEGIADIIKKHIGQPETIRVLEWGCGPGRSVRHLPDVLGASAEVFGTDYNPETIAWCSKHIPNVRFALNGLMPPLPFEGEFFDLVYAISVFTHLSEEACRAWMEEVSRVLKTGGIAFFSTHGGGDEKFLLPHEQKDYIEKGIAVRGSVEEGKKMFGAWHHPDYVKDVMLAKYEVLEHLTPGPAGAGQDFWIARKKGLAEINRVPEREIGREATGGAAL